MTPVTTDTPLTVHVSESQPLSSNQPASDHAQRLPSTLRPRVQEKWVVNPKFVKSG